MDLSWTVQFVLAVASVVVDRKDDLFPPRADYDGKFGKYGGRNASADDGSENVGNKYRTSMHDQQYYEPSSTHQQARSLFSLPVGGEIILGLIFGVPIAMLLPVVRKRQPPPITPSPSSSAEDDEYYGNKASSSSTEDNKGNFDGNIRREGEIADEEVQDGDDDEEYTVEDEGHADEGQGRSFGFGGEEEQLSRRAASINEDLVHEEELGRLQQYFYFMELTSEKCKRRIICEVAAAAEDFYPVSDIILRQIKPKIPVNPGSKSLFSRYLEAAKLGFNGDLKLCAKKHSCSVGGSDIFNHKILRILQLLGRRLNLKFIDR